MRSLIKRAAVITGLLLLPVGYVVAYETLRIVLPPILYICGAMAAITLVLGAVYAWIVGFWMVKTRVVELRSQQMIAAAEAGKAQVLIIQAPKDHQLVVRDPDQESYYRQLHMAPQSHVNGLAVAPTMEQIRIYEAYHGRLQNITEPLMIEGQNEPNLDILNSYNSDWIQSVILPAPHVHYCGATRSGKTTLANCQIDQMRQSRPNTEFHLINPKHTAARKPFIIKPQYKDIDEAIDGLTKFNQVMIRRKNDPELTKKSHQIVFVIDEWDWIFRVYKWQAVRLLEPLIKVGGELNIKVILIGQSPLTTDTGLSQSLYYNMVRVAIGQEGIRLIKNYSIETGVKDNLLSEYNALRSLESRYELQNGHGLRYCAVVPMGGNPSVRIIPYLTDPEQVKDSPAPNPIPTPEEKNILRAWWRMKDRKFSATELHRAIRPDLESRPSAGQLDKYRAVIRKYGYEPKF